MKRNNIYLVVSVLVVSPLLLWAVGDFPKRTLFKDILSALTLVSFAVILGQFFLTRNNRKKLHLPEMSKVIKFHKIIGYITIGIIIFHPFFIVLPRYFEAGLSPIDAFITLITTFSSKGVILGIIAWFLMIIIGITSFFRDSMPMSYKNWRVLHGILSIIFIIIASWHAIDLGRHTNTPMSIFIILISGTGIILLLKTYLSKPKTTVTNE